MNRQLAELDKSPDRPKMVLDHGRMRPAGRRITAISGADLEKLDVPPIEWLVDKILPVGLSMVGAPSKYYKSYMVLGLCVAICQGGKFLDFDCKKHACLYLDLESTKRRPKARLRQIMGPYKSFPDNLYILTSTDGVGRIGEGFEEAVTQQLEDHPDIKLIVVDVFQMIRQAAKRNQTGYDRDYEDFRVLKKIADEKGICIMLVHHTRKMKDPTDVFNELSGSVGVMGALDAAWVITKTDRYSEEGTLYITGRDMESLKLKIRFNKKTFQWEYIGTEEDVNAQRLQNEYDESPLRNTIKKLVDQGGGRWEGSAGEIIEASKYLGSPIYDDVRKIGGLINKYKDLFWTDYLDYEFKRAGHKGKRVYMFFNVSNVSNVTDVSNVSQISIADIADKPTC